jgi:hypothetical protein
MSEPQFDEEPLPVGSERGVVLVEKVFAVYGQLRKEREVAARALQDAERARDEERRAFRKRLANVAVEVFHLRRCVAAMAEAMNGAGLLREMNRLELVVKRFDQALEREAIAVEALDGREIDAALAEAVVVDGYAPADVDVTRVSETLEPQVSVDGQVTRLARVISAVPRESRE